MPRYCFEQYDMTQVTYRTTVRYDDDEDDEYETDDEEVVVLGYWAIYDRRYGYHEPIAYTKSSYEAAKIVEALNRTS